MEIIADTDAFLRAMKKARQAVERLADQMRTAAPRLTRRITLQHIPAGVDASGQPNGTWTEYREVYAEIHEGRGREGLRRFDGVEHAGQVVIEIRHPRGGTFPAVDHRATWIEGDTGSTRTVNITHVERLGHDRKRLLLYCTEVG